MDHAEEHVLGVRSSGCTKVATTTGEFFKMEGVTNVAALGYSVSPSSSEAAKAAGASAQNAGLKVGYLNSAFPFGSTNVAPVALQMKSAGVNGLTDPDRSEHRLRAHRGAAPGGGQPQGRAAPDRLRR